MEKETFIKDLRALANLLEERDFDFSKCDIFDVRIYLKCNSEESFKRNARALGTFDKSWNDYVNATRKFGEKIHFQVTAEREVVCKKIVTGTRIIPAQEERIIPEEVIPASPEREEEIFEYQCPESFINTAKEDL